MFFNRKKKNIVQQIDSAFLEMRNECKASVWDNIQTNAKKLLEKPGTDLVSYFDKYPYTPRIWAFTFSSNLSGDILESGTVCIYRGLLSPTGEEYLKVFTYTTMQLAKEGIVSEETAKENIEAVKKTILSVG